MATKEEKPVEKLGLHNLEAAPDSHRNRKRLGREQVVVLRPGEQLAACVGEAKVERSRKAIAAVRLLNPPNPRI